MDRGGGEGGEGGEGVNRSQLVGQKTTKKELGSVRLAYENRHMICQ